MNKKYIYLLAFMAVGIAISCSVDESKFPLPYNSRTTGAYLRMYMVPSNTFDITNAGTEALSGFECVYEPVDGANGNDTDSIRFYVSFRRGAALSREKKVKAVSVAAFTAPTAPTYSVYKRGTIRITMAETLAALAPIIGIDVDGPGPIAGAAPSSGLAAYPGPPIANGDQFIFRMIQVLKDGRKFTVLNPQFPVNPTFGNPTEENGTPNITTGLFYNSPFTYTITARLQFATNAFTGTYTLVQRQNWAPSHSTQLHEVSYPAYMNAVNFPSQTVTLSVPTGGLPTNRVFNVTYRGVNTSMRINLDPGNPLGGLSGANTTAALLALNTSVTPAPGTAPGFGFGTVGPLATAGNLGTVLVLLQNSTADCSSTREFYWITPASGVFGGSLAASTRFTSAPGLPFYVTPNRGAYLSGSDGLTAGNVFTIGVDDDADEYGRRNGYCTWTRRMTLHLTKQ